MSLDSKNMATGPKQAIGYFDVVMLAAGTAIGVSIFSSLGPGAKVAGAGMLIAIPIAMVPMGIFCLVYAFMSSVQPRSGASYEWPREYVSPGFAFIVTWLRILSSIGMLATNVLVLIQYLSEVFPVPNLPARFLILLLIFLANFRGIGTAARLQSVSMILLLAALGVMVVAGAPHISAERIGSPLDGGILPIILCLPLMVKLFTGIETATEIGEEVHDARRTIPRALLTAVVTTALVYIGMTFTVLAMLGPTALASSDAPLLDAARISVGPWAAVLVMIAAVASLIKSLNAIFLVFSRYLFAMGRSGALPMWIGVVDEHTGTPRRATIVAFACAVMGLALPTDLIFLFIAAVIPLMFKYLSTCLSAFRLTLLRPDLLAQSGRYATGGKVRAIALAGMLCALALLVIGIGTDWRPYLLVGIWAIAGLLYWHFHARVSLETATRSAAPARSAR